MGTMQPEEYRCGPLIRFDHGPGLALMHFPLAGFNRRMSSLEASAVSQWTAFQTVHDAVRGAVSLIPSISEESLRALFFELRDCGALVSIGQLASPLPQDPPGQVDWLVIPTSGRTECVSRAIASFVGNMNEFGRSCKIFLADDANCAPSDSSCRKMLASMKPEQLHRISYAGAGEKRAYAELLSNDARVPKEAVEYLLHGSQFARRHAGANRNAILLQTLGTMVLSVDDDTVCTAGRVADATTKLVVAGHDSAEESWCFAGTNDAHCFVKSARLDVLAEHEVFLGRSLPSITQAAALTGGNLDLDGMCGHLFESMLSGHGRIALTCNGAVGDSGFHSDLGLVSHRSRETRARIQQLNDSYQTITRSRKIVRQAPCATITHVDAFSVGMFLGMDNRGLDAGTLLPPFMPDFDNEDGVFARTVAACCPGAYAGHLPFTLVHDPPVDRQYAADRDTTYRMCDVLGWCLSAWRPAGTGSSSYQPIAALGLWFQELASRQSAELAEFLTIMACSHRSSQIESLESLLAEDGYMPEYWAADLSSRIEAMRLASEYDFSRPGDLLVSDDEEVMPAIQSVLTSYGRLLEWWPAITQRAQALADDGIYLGRSV